MTWYPIAFIPPQIEDASGLPYSGAVLKAYVPGSTTNIPMATDNTGATTAATVLINALGYPTYLGTVVIPHLQENYKLALYPDQASADADSGAIWTIPEVQIADATNTSFIQYFDGDGVNATFTLSEDLGNDENILMVFSDRAIAEYAANTNFASDTIWTKGAGWTIGAGVATAAGAISTAIQQNATSPLIPGQTYTVEFTVTASAGTLTPSVGGNSGTTRGVGTWRENIVAGSTQVIAFTGVGFTGTLDNATVKGTGIFARLINRPDEYTLVGNQLTLNNIPPSGTKNVIVFAPSLLLGAANNAAAAAATSEANALNYANLADADRIQTGLDRIQTGLDATAAANSANAAAAAAAGGLYGNIETLTFADSPFVPPLAKEGTLYRCDCTGGAIVINLSALSVYNEDTKFAFVKVDASANGWTANRGGTDTINGANSTSSTNRYEVHALLGDLGSGTWADVIQAATLADDSVTNAKLNNMAANTIKVNATGSSDNPTDLAMGASTFLARLAAGNIVAATVAEVLTLLGLAVAPRSEVYVDTGNGHGSTATKIRRFTNTRKNVGTAITYADSATGGGSFTINETGLYCIQYSDYKTSAATFLAITVNAASLTTNANATTYANGRRLGVNTLVAGAANTASWTGLLTAADVVRAHTDGTPDATDAFCAFSICKVNS